jgi:hypothetical protein
LTFSGVVPLPTWDGARSGAREGVIGDVTTGRCGINFAALGEDTLVMDGCDWVFWIEGRDKFDEPEPPNGRAGCEESCPRVGDKGTSRETGIDVIGAGDKGPFRETDTGVMVGATLTVTGALGAVLAATARGGDAMSAEGVACIMGFGGAGGRER